jgi:hypothetical protein
MAMNSRKIQGAMSATSIADCPRRFRLPNAGAQGTCMVMPDNMMPDIKGCA